MDQVEQRPTIERLFNFPTEATKVPGSMHFYIRLFAKAGDLAPASIANQASMAESMAIGMNVLPTGFLYLGTCALYMLNGQPIHITPEHLSDHGKMLIDFLRDNIPSMATHAIYAVIQTEDPMIGSMLDGSFDSTARKM